VNTIFLYCLIAGGIAGVLVILSSFKNGLRAIFSGLGAALFGFGLEFFVLYTLMPSFAHWTSTGYFLTAFVVLVSAIAFSYIAHGENGYESDYTGSYILTGIGVLGFIVALLISAFVVPPALINNQIWDEIAALAEVRDATEEDLSISATDDDLLKVSPGAANLQAKGEMPGDLGSYTQIGNSFEQTYNGEQVYITDLHVTSWRGFRNNGKALPGYFVRSAKDIDAQTNFVAGYNMTYVPAARWNVDLNRHVYLNYRLNCNCYIDHLDTLEIDNNGDPKYTGTVWKYTIGNKGMVATNVIVVDPETGQIDKYLINEAPEWIDRIFSLEMMKDRIDNWAKYSEWDAKIPQDATGKMKVDAAEDVYGPEGKLEYMITISSAGSDQTLKYDLRVNPRTGEVIKYKASGKTISAVDDLIDEQTFTDEINTALGAEPIELERQLLLGEWVYYSILESRSEGEGSSGSIVGFAFLQEKHTSSPNMVIVADNFAEAWNKLRKQITTSSRDSQIQSEQADTIVVEGVILQVANFAIDDMILFVVATDENEMGYYFRVSSENPIISLSEPGDEVTIVAYDLNVSDINDVLSLQNKNLPPLNNQ
jgi:hypothetical protein